MFSFSFLHIIREQNIKYIRDFFVLDTLIVDTRGCIGEIDIFWLRGANCSRSGPDIIQLGKESLS